MSEEQTRLVLNLEQRFEKTPALKTLLTSGKVSINKLSRIASIAKENEENFTATKMDFEDQNGLRKSFFGSKSLPGQTQNTLNLSQEVHEKLLSLQQKDIDINALLEEFLQKREDEIAQKKEEILQEISERKMEKSSDNFPQNISEKPVTRHIPISIKRILYAEHGTKCSIKNCQKSSKQIHHMQGFSAVKSHDPRYLAPLCKEHHELAHCTDNDYIEIRQRVK